MSKEFIHCPARIIPNLMSQKAVYKLFTAVFKDKNRCGVLYRRCTITTKRTITISILFFRDGTVLPDP